jgi:Na+-driven multidrug efflux pump
MTFLLFMKDNILSLFTSDPDITLLAVEALVLFCLAMIPDALIFA